MPFPARRFIGLSLIGLALATLLTVAWQKRPIGVQSAPAMATPAFVRMPLGQIDRPDVASARPELAGAAQASFEGALTLPPLSPYLQGLKVDAIRELSGLNSDGTEEPAIST